MIDAARRNAKQPAPQRAGFFVLASWCAWAACAAAMLPARAQVEATGDYLARMDADADGRVALAEYQDWMSYAFVRMDRNADGVLSTDELPGGKGKPVSLVEHKQTLADRFARQDRNRDGYLDAKELAAPPQ